MATFTEKEYEEYKNQYIHSCASGDFPRLAKVDSLRSLGGTYAKSDFDLDMLKVDIKTKHFKKRLSKKKARALLAELKSIEPAAKSDYAKNMLAGLQEYVGRCEVLCKRKTIIGSICGAMCAVLLCVAVVGLIWLDKTGMLYGTNSIRFTADGQEYTQCGAVKYKNYVQLSSMPTKKGYDATGIVDTKTNTVLFDATGKSLSEVSNKDLSDYVDCDLEVIYEPHVYSAKVMTAENVSAVTVSYTVEDEPEDVLDEPQRLEGYVFDGWFTDSKYRKPFTGNFMDYADLKEPLVLYPHYSLDGWTLTWNLNGGTFVSDVMNEYTILTNMPLPDGDTVERTGYTLNGWLQDGKQIEYFTPTIMRDTTLTAVWEANTYKIDYELNGGLLDGAETGYTIEDEFAFDEPIRDGYVFEGWYTNKIFTKPAIAIESGTIGDKVLYAKWVPITYSIAYEMNDGENSPLNPNTYTAEKNVKLQNPIRKGYTFEGWLSNSEKVTELNAVEHENVTLSAMWQANEYTITVMPNNGEDVYTKPVHYDENYSIEQPLYAGYEFKGFTVGGVPISIQGVYQYTNDVTVSANYEPIVYSIGYELNGGNNSSFNPISYTAEKNVLLQNPQKTGYTFEGWYDGSDKVTELKAAQNENVTLVANWKANEYTITINPNNGEQSYTQIIYYDESYVLPEPIRKGYTFTGYTVGGKAIDNIGTYLFVSDITVIATYKANDYTITYVSDSQTVFTQEVTYDKAYALYTPEIKANYEFAGWYDKEVGGRKISDGIYNTDCNTVLYASWEKVLTINLESDNDYTIDSSIEKAYIKGNYNGSNDLMANINIKIPLRYSDLTIVLINAGFKASNDNSAIRADSDGFALTVVATGDCYVCGGNGTASSDPSKKSNDGKAAIDAARLTLMSENANSFKLQGGDGAKGARGTDGAKESTGWVWCDWGHSGGTGGTGGNSGSAIRVITYTDYSDAELLKGSAGAGGDGGSAGYRAGWFAKTWGSDGTKGKDGEVVPVIQYKSEWK